MSGQARRSPPGPGWQDPARPGWVVKTFRLGPQTQEALKNLCGLFPEKSENWVVGHFLLYCNQQVESRLDPETLKRYHAGKLSYAEYQDIRLDFWALRLELGPEPTWAEVAEKAATKRKGKPEEKIAAE